ncbi:DEAD/DEAH box helicase (plasmid) [Methylomarinum sp. Ch1-1]|uniref:DEAD/DEAH box helicase n=1 Tax=Methylomarinum roseum TaxID=3067653 RepID=A0AAU7P0B3_9GAMM|nr:DEAD/DEAH box helicase [Methylomarinum sp. Ch1-1]MDP4523294.1 DEAD/DEAH box helicase [Methylomarinum sp. Ch1-1]
MDKLSPDQLNVLDLIASGKNIFLTGKAGSGKSEILKALRKKRTDGDTVFLSTTGMAAMNINGCTAHRFFRFGLSLLDPDKIQKEPVKREFEEMIKYIKTIVIDEISMCRADVLEAIDRRLKKACRSELPFGGKQMVLVGDPFQLAPVVQTSEKAYFSKSDLFNGEYFFDAPAWRKGRFTCVNLSEVFRRDPDSDQFIDALNDIRVGVNKQGALSVINQRINASIDSETPPVFLCAMNKQAHEANVTALKSISGKGARYKGRTAGEVDEAELPVPKELLVKIGARVIAAANHEEGLYVNGSTGTVLDFNREKIIIKFDHSESPVEVVRKTWPINDYIYDEDKNQVETKTIGAFEQFPLKLAWALTIHKSQGQTLDNVHLDLGEGAFAYGQIYVALSRVRSLNALSTSKFIKPRDIAVDPRVKQFAEEYIHKNEKLKLKNIAIPEQYELDVRRLIEELKEKDRLASEEIRTQNIASMRQALN